MNQKEFLIAISEALEVDPNIINMELKLGDLEEWDSLGHLTILSNLDSLTGEKASEIKDFGSLGSLQAIWNALVSAGLAA
jgi:acyl carrier protein